MHSKLLEVVAFNKLELVNENAGVLGLAVAPQNG